MAMRNSTSVVEGVTAGVGAEVFLHPRPSASAAPSDPLAVHKEAAALKGRQVTGRGVIRGVMDLHAAVHNASGQLGALATNRDLSDQGRAKQAAALKQDIVDRGAVVLDGIATTKAQVGEPAVPGERLLPPLSDEFNAGLHHGTAQQVLVAVDGATTDREINNMVWAVAALVAPGGRLTGSPQRLDLLGARNRAVARSRVIGEILHAMYVGSAMDVLDHITRLTVNEFVRRGSADFLAAYAATRTFKILAEPTNLVQHWDEVVQAARTPASSPLVLQPDGSLRPGAETEAEAFSPWRDLDDSGSRGT